MKNLSEMSIVPILQLILIVGSIILAYNGVDGWEFFVEPGTQPTWEELKEISK
jgi:hypothetical protein